jgi:hypothetical protein
MGIKELFPCQICKKHLTGNLKKYNLSDYLLNSSSMFMWSYLIHNEVNEMNNKMSPPYNSCLGLVQSTVDNIEIIPNLFFTLFTLIEYNNSKDKIGYFIMLMTTLKYLIPMDSVRHAYTYVLEKHKTVDFSKVSLLFWVYSIYKEVNSILNIPYYSYEVISEYFLRV